MIWSILLYSFSDENACKPHYLGHSKHVILIFLIYFLFLDVHGVWTISWPTQWKVIRHNQHHLFIQNTNFFIFYFLCVWVLDNDYMIVLFDGFWLSRFKVITIMYYLCRACCLLHTFSSVLLLLLLFSPTCLPQHQLITSLNVYFLDN